MHKKIVLTVFIMAIAALAVIYIQNRYFTAPEERITAARVVVPQVGNNEVEEESEQEISEYLDPEMVSLVALNPGETLLATVNSDFDGDTYEDQINAIRSGTSPYISLIVGLYNVQKGEYERVATIATPIRQMRTFSYTGMDLTGDHRMALVYQGFVDTGNAVLQAFFISRENGNIKVTQIANLEGDGTIFIQQEERSEAYTRSKANDKSFAIWVYSSDSAHPDSTDQIHTRYDWNESLFRYEMSDQSRVTGSRISASDLARIQDGTVETFASFLNGLWYKTDSKQGMHFLYFDYPNKQIIFMLQDLEEVYDWQTSNVRRNGIYISATNLEIQNLQRRIDVALRNTDEIRVSLHDDLRVIVTESSDWNGEYKKMNDATSYLQQINERVDPSIAFIEDLESGSGWNAADGTFIVFENGHYTATGDTGTDTGAYASLNADKPYIQFRSDSGNGFFKKFYLMTYAPTEDGGVDMNSIVLQPYVVGLEKSYPSEEHLIILTRAQQTGPAANSRS